MKTQLELMLDELISKTSEETMKDVMAAMMVLPIGNHYRLYPLK
jgi:hypothetical protein